MAPIDPTWPHARSRGRTPGTAEPERRGSGRTLLEKALAGRSLADDGEPDQSDEESEEPPTNRLRMYRPLDGRIARILRLDPVVGGKACEVLEVDLETGQVGGSVAQADKPLVDVEGLASLPPIKCWARVQVVDGGDARREVRHIRLDADDTEGDPAPTREGLPFSTAPSCASE